MEEVVHQQIDHPENVRKRSEMSGPCRELATTMLAQRIEHLRRELIGLEELKKIADGMIPGSAGEETMWGMLVAARAAERRATW